MRPSMKKYCLTFIFSFFLCFVFAQTNSWINFSQTYFKIPIYKNGIYKLDSAFLASNGFPIASTDPRNIQVFQFGEEQAIYIQGENDGVLNAQDFILFYARKNTCKEDSLLFGNIPFLSNPYNSIINDTSAVFLTSNTLSSNKRYALELDTNFSSYVPADYYFKENIFSSNGYYYEGPEIISGVKSPLYAFGEGLYHGDISMGNSQNFLLNLVNPYSGSIDAELSIVYSGTSDAPGLNPDKDISIEYADNTGAYSTLFQNSFNGFKTYKRDFVIPNAGLGAGNSIRFSNLSNSAYAASSTRVGVHYVKVKYPKTFNLGGLSDEQMILPDNLNSTKSLLPITSIVMSGTAYVFDMTNTKIIPAIAQNSTSVNALVPNSNGLKKLFVSSEGYFIRPDTLFPGKIFTNPLANLPDSAYILIYPEKLSLSAQQYKNYRSGINGGSHNVVAVTAEDLSDQFAYGVKRHPLSIQLFCKDAYNLSQVKPSNLFIIGKSVKSSDCWYSPNNAKKCLVPTFGSPASDNLFTAGFNNPNSITPLIPTGRLAAKNDSDVIAYLNKVMLNESQTQDFWQKNILHFVGGMTANEQSSFNGYMNQNESIIEDTLFGGDVYTFRKTVSSPIAINTNDSIKEIIEKGVNLITFFGHGSYVGFEQNIDDPFAYNSSPKFPMMLANSCYTGDIHTPNYFTNSERFVLANDHGTIGFIASVSTGVSFALQNFTKEFYKGLSYLNYGETYGKVLNSSIARAEHTATIIQDSISLITCMEMSLHGDPACVPYSRIKPDYVITNNSVTVDAQSEIDSIQLEIKITNEGKAINDSIMVFTERQFPNGNSSTFTKRIKAPLHSSVLRFSIPKDIVNGIGLNRFAVTVDYFNEISETSETNNSTNGFISIFVPGGDISPVYPYKYAVIPRTDSVVLKASTSDPFFPQTLYRFQLDTNDSFQNPILNTVVSSAGGVVELPVALPFGDSTVYFWRVAKDSSSIASIRWRESSFQCIQGKKGWSQAHFHQFKNNEYQFVRYDKPQRKFDFANNVSVIAADLGNVMGPFYAQSFAQNGYTVNNVMQNYWTCGGGPGWTFAVFDSISGKAYLADTVGNFPAAWHSQYFSCVCTPEIRPAFDFGFYDYCGDPVDYRQRVETFLNSIPVGSRVLAYSHENDSASTFSSALRNAFATIGSDSISSKPDTCVMLIWGTKRASPHNQARELIGRNGRDIVSFEDTIASHWDRGYIASEIIGPSLEWHSLHWRFSSLENPSSDSVYLRLVGIKANGQTDTILDFPSDSLDVLNLSTYVSASTYPYLQLISYQKDRTFNTPPQLERWQVLFSQAPEAAVNPKEGYSILKNTVQEGETIELVMPIENIGELSFVDSLVISYWIETNTGVTIPLPDKKKKNNFSPYEILKDSIRLSTLGLQSRNALWIDVNPLNHPMHQTEEYHFNNIVRVPFEVSKDNVNPLLDVTFDGVHLLNGDIVSPKPSVLISLKDENKFLALNDTSDFIVRLKKPGNSIFTQLNFNNDLVFTPAQLPNNSCKIEYKPEFADDGIYELSVQARDRSSNLSGSNDYKIQFEVITKSTITEVLNYPNPFSTSTRFVFTLTGSEIPETFKIQIMTVSGKIVKEIEKEELGEIRIGRNISEYTWDGKDEFGDALANGVYLYKVTTKIKGSEIEKRSTKADEYFKKGWGKMVIMR